MEFSYTKISECISELEIIKNKLGDNFDDISANIKKIGSSNVWSGEAASAYKTKASNVASNFDLIIHELKDAILYLNSVANNYKSLDEKVMSSSLFSSNFFR